MIKALTVSQFIESVNLLLGDYEVVVEGEVSEFRVNQNKWVFFNLKDKQSTVNCFMVIYQLRVPLEDGMQVRVYGYPKLYNKTGRFSLIVQKVEPAGEGALKRAYELLKAKLEQEGLFAPERKRPIVRFPQKIGLIASPESAAYSDFIKILQARFGGLEIYLAGVAVQGEQAVGQIVSAFTYFNQNEKDLDAVVLTRGGGSLEDLQAFNSEEVARAVFGSRFPVVCGVGHERDESLADFVADVRASTPSNAAELLVPTREEINQEIEHLKSRLEQSLKNKILSCQEGINNFQQVFESFWQRLEEQRRFIASQFEHLPLMLERAIGNFKDKIEARVRLLNSLNPKRILQRGFSITYKQGKVVKNSQDLGPGDEVKIQLAKGGFGSEVKVINN